MARNSIRWAQFLMAFAYGCGSGSASALYDPGERDRGFGGPAAGCSAQSRPGDCAIAFDQDGSTFEDTGKAVLRTTDGSYVAVGEVAKPGDMPFVDIGLARLLRDGRLDSAFGDNGRRIHDLGLVNVAAAALDAQDRILVAGAANIGVGTMDLAVVRFAADGSLDATFGSGGKTIVNCGAAYERVSDLAVDGDGRVLVLASYHEAASALPSGTCFATLDGDGNEFATSPRYLEDGGDIRNAASAIDVSGPDPRFAIVGRCSGNSCPFSSVATVYAWDFHLSGASPGTPVILDEASAPAGCTVLAARPRGPLAAFADGSLVQLLETYDGNDDERSTWLAVNFLPNGTAAVSCLTPSVPSNMYPDLMLPTGDGSTDLYLLGNSYTDGSNASRQEGVRRLLRAADGRYIADDSFDGGQPRLVQVRGAGGAALFNDPAQSNQRALVDPGVPGDVPPLPQLVVAGTRQYSPFPGEDYDFYVARLGSDAALFADGLEAIAP